MTKINSQPYWENRFKTNWLDYQGDSQTKFFTQIAVDNLPNWLIKDINLKNLDIADLGCAEGDASPILKKKFPKSNIIGIDFSPTAIKKARIKYPNFDYKVKNLSTDLIASDVLFVSNTLEHFSDYPNIVSKLASNTKHHLIIMLPFQETEKHSEHETVFDYESFNLQIENLKLTYGKIINCKNILNSLWPQKQILLVYSYKQNMNKIPLFPLYHTSETKLLENQYQVMSQEVSSTQKELEIIHKSKLWKLLVLIKKIKKIPIKLKLLIPIGFRKKIKSVFTSVLPRPKFQIPIDILNEWKSWNTDERTNNSIDFLNFSVISWDFRFQRPQQIATQLASKGHRVFYIQNEFIENISDDNSYSPIKVEKKSKNIYLITLSSSHNLFIYQDKPTSKDTQLMMASLKFLINQAQIVNPIAKIDHPFWSCLLEKLSMTTVYDCMDYHQGFADNKNHLIKSEQKLFINSQLTITSSNYLTRVAEKCGSPNNLLIPNAGDYDHFSIVTQTKLKIPQDMTEILHPIIGYYGALAEWFDTDMLLKVAKENPDKSIVLIGNVTNSKIQNIADKCKNIYLLGEKTYQELPSYLQQFDLCWIPFILNELIKATHPVKIFEYFAAGKTVVSTKLPEISELKKHIYFADKKNICTQINRALKNPFDSKDLQSVASKNTWLKRSESLLDYLYKHMFPKVSIVLLSYNNSKMVKKTIDSVINRSLYPNYELIIVDNNSDTETVEILKSYANNPNIKIILESKNHGFAKGNNIGTRIATGDYIILLNNDVLVTPGWIERLVYHASDSNIGLVGPVTNSIGNEAKINIEYDVNNTPDLENTSRNHTAYHWGQKFELSKIAAFCWIIRKSIYDTIGELDEQFGIGMFEDDDYCLRISQKGLKIYCAEDVFIHHFGATSFKKLRSLDYQQLFLENKTKFEKKWKLKWTPHHNR